MFVPGEATILHADVDAFYASVEQRDDPRLRGRSVIVAAGGVLAASGEARADGGRAGMSGARAPRLCARAVVVGQRVGAASRAGRAATAGKLRGRGITTVGEVAGLAEAALVSMLGRASGRHLHALAHNRAPRTVQVGRRRRSIGSQRALGRAPRSPAALDAVVVALVDRVTRRL